MSVPSTDIERLRGRLFKLLIVAADWRADMYRYMQRGKVWNMAHTQDSLRFGMARLWFTVSAVANSAWRIKSVNKLFLLKPSSHLLTSSQPRLTSDQIFLHRQGIEPQPPNLNHKALELIPPCLTLSMKGWIGGEALHTGVMSGGHTCTSSCLTI